MFIVSWYKKRRALHKALKQLRSADRGMHQGRYLGDPLR
jgi:hypothetical protein